MRSGFHPATRRVRWHPPYLFDTVSEVHEITEPWRYDYNHERPHAALAGLSPVAFAAAALTP